MTSTTPPTTELDHSIWRGRRATTSLGLFALAFLVAFEALAVITVMPLVARDLDALSWYAVAFAVPVAVSVLSRTVAAPWIDARGPGVPMVVGVATFAVGLIVCGVAPSIGVLLLGRAVQGVGMGVIGVALYVVVALAYPERLRPRAMTVLTSAWVAPAVVGPAAAGGLAHLAGWRAVFLAGPVLAALCLVLVGRAALALPGSGAARWSRRRTLLAGLVATAILLVSVAGQQTVPGWPVVLVLGLAALVLGAVKLLPRGTWTGGPVVPTLIGVRATVGAAYFCAESVVPLALVEVRGVAPTVAGLTLTAAACTWFAGSWLAAHPSWGGPLLSTRRRRVVSGALAVCLGLVAGPLSLAPGVPLAVVAAVWSVGGLGMGIALSSLSVWVIDRAASAEVGAVSADLQTADAMGESTFVALGSVAFAALLGAGVVPALEAVFAVAAVAALWAGLLLLRLEGDRAPSAERPTSAD